MSPPSYQKPNYSLE